MVLPALAACTGVGVTYRKSLARTQNNSMEAKTNSQYVCFWRNKYKWKKESNVGKT